MSALFLITGAEGLRACAAGAAETRDLLHQSMAEPKLIRRGL